MIPFIGPGVSPWPASVRVPHLYALPDPALPANKEFFALAERRHVVLTGRFADLVTPVAPQWLHATVRMVTEPTAALPLPKTTLDWKDPLARFPLDPEPER